MVTKFYKVDLRSCLPCLVSWSTIINTLSSDLFPAPSSFPGSQAARLKQGGLFFAPPVSLKESLDSQRGVSPQLCGRCGL